MDLIVLSHLRWNFVWQRPQHLMSRFARNHRVFFVEEPEYREGCSPRWEVSEPVANVFVCRPVTSVSTPGFQGEQAETLRQMIPQLLERHQLKQYVAWFYTPMALPLLDELRPESVIYDCMDELSAFLHAPVESLQCEEELLRRADVVFTGGPSLYRAKQHRHGNVHCFKSSVDAVHFGQAKMPLEAPESQQSLPHPRLGFFGVIDERFDIELLRAAAETRPSWQFVMVGPVVTIHDAAAVSRTA